MLKLTAPIRPEASATADQLGRLGRGHGQRLLADHVATGGQDLSRLRHVQVVGRCDMHDLDGLVVEQGLERGVGPGDAEGGRPLRTAFRAAAEDPADVDADAPQGFDVDGADEAGADDGGPDRGGHPRRLPL